MNTNSTKRDKTFIIIHPDETIFCDGYVGLQDLLEWRKQMELEEKTHDDLIDDIEEAFMGDDEEALRKAMDKFFKSLRETPSESGEEND